MGNQITGRVYIRIDGMLLKSKSDAKLSGITGVSRKAVIGNDVHGYTEEAVAPSVECKISHDKTTSLTTLGAITDATLTFECDTGPIYTLRNAWLEEPPDLTGGGGEVTLKFTAKKCEEVL